MYNQTKRKVDKGTNNPKTKEDSQNGKIANKLVCKRKNHT
jgi:hypothetical protein